MSVKQLTSRMQALELDGKHLQTDRGANNSLYFVEIWDIGEELAPGLAKASRCSRMAVEYIVTYSNID